MLKKLIKKLFTKTLCFQTEKAYHRITRITEQGRDYTAAVICGFESYQQPCLRAGDRMTIQHKYKNRSPIIYKVLFDVLTADEAGYALVKFSPVILDEDKGRHVTLYRKINVDS
jgi:hypothetical protein